MLATQHTAPPRVGQAPCLPAGAAPTPRPGRPLQSRFPLLHPGRGTAAPTADPRQAHPRPTPPRLRPWRRRRGPARGCCRRASGRGGGVGRGSGGTCCILPSRMSRSSCARPPPPTPPHVPHHIPHHVPPPQRRTRPAPAAGTLGREMPVRTPSRRVGADAVLASQRIGRSAVSRSAPQCAAVRRSAPQRVPLLIPWARLKHRLQTGPRLLACRLNQACALFAPFLPLHRLPPPPPF